MSGARRELTGDDVLRNVRQSKRRKPSNVRYRLIRNRDEARLALVDAIAWLDELAHLPGIGHDGEHCVGQALLDLVPVHGFLTRGDKP